MRPCRARESGSTTRSSTTKTPNRSEAASDTTRLDEASATCAFRSRHRPIDRTSNRVESKGEDNDDDQQQLDAHARADKRATPERRVNSGFCETRPAIDVFDAHAVETRRVEARPIVWRRCRGLVSVSYRLSPAVDEPEDNDEEKNEHRRIVMLRVFLGWHQQVSNIFAL